MNMVIQALILIVLLGAVPFLVGGIPVYMADRKTHPNLILRWIGGQFILWAGFQLICVPLILKQRDFSLAVVLYGVYQAALLLLVIAMGLRNRARKMSVRWIHGYDRERQGSDFLLWLVFLGLLLFQLVQSVRLAYADGDDAYYVAVSSITNDAETMYRKLPYTGGETGLDVRHGLAPFPIWIAFLARISGMQVVTLAQVVLPGVLIVMTYAIFYLLGCHLFPQRNGKLPLFLIFTEILVLFGDYSHYTVENFMIARSRQGKAALGSIVIPFLLYLLLLLLQRLQEKKKIPAAFYLMLASTVITGCLCSTLGALLVCMLVGITGLAGAVCYRERRILLPMLLCCIPCVCYAVIYLLFE